MAASTQVKSPFLSGAPVSFERLDSPDSGKPVSAMQSTTSSQEINSWWNNYLAPTTSSSPAETNIASNLPEKTVFSKLETTTVTETKVSSFNVRDEIIFNPKETVLAQAVIAEGSIDVKTEQTKSIPSFTGVLEKIDLSGGVDAAKKSVKTTKDVRMAIWDIFKSHVFFKNKKEEPKKKDDKKKAPAPFNLRPVMSEDRKHQMQTQAEDINRRLKTRNTSYEGVFNSDGSVRADIQALLDKANSQLEESQLKQKKEAQLANLSNAGGKKGARGPRVSTNLNLAAEDSNSASKLLG